MPAWWLVECGADCPCREVVEQQGPRCKCGLYLLGDGCAYCEKIGKGQVLRIELAAVRESSEGVEAWRSRIRAASREETQAALRKAGVNVPSAGTLESSSAHAPTSTASETDSGWSTAPMGLRAKSPPAARPKRKPRRSKAEMLEVRSQEKIRDSAVLERATRGTFLEGREAELTEFMEMINE